MRGAFFFALFLLLLPNSARAATQGTLGATSTATLVITVVIPERIRISGMDDLSLAGLPGVPTALSANDDICVYKNSSSTQYSYTLTDTASNKPKNSFAVENAAGNSFIAYSVRWNSQPGTVGNVAVGYNTRLTGANPNTQSTDCSVGGNSANIQVNFSAAAVGAAPGGSYSTTLNVLVEP